MKTGVIFLSILTFISIFLIAFFDSILMPKYVRMGTGRYMVNVIEKNLSYGLKVLDSEGYKIVVSDTLFTGVFEPGTIVDQYPKPNTRVKKGRTIRLKISQPEKMVSIPDLIGNLVTIGMLRLSSGMFIGHGPQAVACMGGDLPSKVSG